MARLLERMFVLLVTFSLVLWGITALLNWLLALIARSRVAVAPFIESIVTTTLVGCASVGVLVRLGQLIQDRRAGSARGTGRASQIRRAVRRPTDEPGSVERPRRLEPDSDPALTFDGEEEP